MKKSIIRILIASLILTTLGGLALHVYTHRFEESTDDAAINGTVVTISTKVPGYVKVLHMDDNQSVKTGDILLEIDPADYETRRNRAHAALEAAQAAAQAARNHVETTSISAPSTLDAAQAQVVAAEAAWNKASKDLQRMQAMSSEARSQEQLEQAISSEKTTLSNLKDAQAKLRAAKTAPHAIAQAQATSDQLAAQVKQAATDLAQAELDLTHTKIIAPIDGHIAKRGVARGNYVQTGQALASLVGTNLWVVANFKETQLNHIHPGLPVNITVDAYPSLALTGRVDSIQSGTGSYFSVFPPENATGNFVKVVQRVPVKIILDHLPNTGKILGPGMSVIPTVLTDPGK